MTGRIGVAISTTGHEHRMGFLETCVRRWCEIPGVHSLFVTVDGSQEDAERVAKTVFEHTGSVFRVGQCVDNCKPLNNRLGVAVNKNTGLELLMDNGQVEHAFLCDDDTWPLSPKAPLEHINMGFPHSMVCWGRSRAPKIQVGGYASWSWPRGALLYVRPEVLAQVGGMDERFGAPGGHEHVEWSRRIHQAGLTPVPYVTPTRYARQSMGAAALWHAEDMPRKGEGLGLLRHRKAHLTTIHRPAGYWDQADTVMAERDGDTSYVPFRAMENGRQPATLIAPRA